MRSFRIKIYVGELESRFAGRRRGLTWTFDLTGIGEMYASYEATSLWPFLRRPAQGVRVSFVRAEGSNYRWAGGDEQRISALGHDVHLLRQAGARRGASGAVGKSACMHGSRCASGGRERRGVLQV